ncbi:MAG TPA: S41 family peptidase [Acetivibrio sp.]|uniref:S41 family peptidase n=1 Tax=Acetivibrio sp. TaxID=1872092 RepID=UPI002BA3D9CE|nr:S41 family peptidase [Acetivibrio sp.]HOM03606.1 S41 family peptidase [Acetivibrio sp.]
MDESSFTHGYGDGQIEIKDLGDNAVYVKIKSFTLDLEDKFIEKLDKIENPKEKILVIDLRDNRGGYILTADAILDYLLPECLIYYYTYFWNGYTVSPYSAADYVEFKQILILVNENTANSAELLTLGLKKHLKNTIVIGRTTFGENTSHIVYHNEEEGFAVYLASFYWNVEGQNLTESGITPDIVVKNDSDYMKEVEKLLQLAR